MYYCGFSYADAMILPVPQRLWFVQRVQKEMKATHGGKEATNDPTMAALTGQMRAQVPLKMKRF